MRRCATPDATLAAKPMSSRCWGGWRSSCERAPLLADPSNRQCRYTRLRSVHGVGVHQTHPAADDGHGNSDTPAGPAAASAQDMSVLAREHAECDRQVAILMSTKDLVELERAQFLIKWINCSVGRRLPRS